MNFVRLDQGERFEQLVERAKPAREDDESVAVLNKHHLADKEVFEFEREGQVKI